MDAHQLHGSFDSTTSSDNSFSSSTSSYGASYPLIAEHVFQYPGTFDVMKLKDMYTMNVGITPAQQEAAASNSNSSGSSQRAAAQAAAAQFSSALSDHIARLPSQPCSLPPVFITNFLLRCFPLELELVDFPQALTGIDYLKDLEKRRRRETEACLRRIGIEPTGLGRDGDISTRHAGVAAWLRSIESAERKVDSLYTQIYTGLRKWVLINELSLLPFNKHNCLAMLNTLYPPTASISLPPSPTATQIPRTVSPAPNPTRSLTPTVLKNQRDTFFKWTRTVETRGIRSLETLKKPDMRHSEDTTGWPAVHEILDAYLRVANHIIEECNDIRNLEDFDLDGLKTNNKKDSGISFISTDSRRPSVTTYNGNRNKALPTPPNITAEFLDELSGARQQQDSPATIAPKKGLSRLEKIARELRWIKLTRNSTKRTSSEDYGPSEDQQSVPNTPNLHSRNNSDSNEPKDNSQSVPSSPRFCERNFGTTVQGQADGNYLSANQPAHSRRPLNSRRSFSRSRVETPLASPDVNEMPRPPTAGSSTSGSWTLRKLRSLGDLKRPATSSGETTPALESPFNKEEMLKAKAAWEARQAQLKDDEFWMVQPAAIGLAQ